MIYEAGLKKVQPSDFTMQGHEPSDPLTVDICFGITLGSSQAVHETNKVSPLISSRFKEKRVGVIVCSSISLVDIGGKLWR